MTDPTKLDPRTPTMGWYIGRLIGGNERMLVQVHGPTFITVYRMDGTRFADAGPALVSEWGENIDDAFAECDHLRESAAILKQQLVESITEAAANRDRWQRERDDLAALRSALTEAGVTPDVDGVRALVEAIEGDAAERDDGFMRIRADEQSRTERDMVGRLATYVEACREEVEYLPWVAAYDSLASGLRQIERGEATLDDGPLGAALKADPDPVPRTEPAADERATLTYGDGTTWPWWVHVEPLTDCHRTTDANMLYEIGLSDDALDAAYGEGWAEHLGRDEGFSHAECHAAAHRLHAEILRRASAPRSTDPAADERVTVDAMRAEGWAVAVHNDYRLGGVAHTFWLFTRGNECVSGEGLTDADALADIAAKLSARGSAPRSTGEPAPDDQIRAIDRIRWLAHYGRNEYANGMGHRAYRALVGIAAWCDEVAGAPRSTGEPAPDGIFSDEVAMACVAKLVSNGHSPASVHALMSRLAAAQRKAAKDGGT